MLCWQERGALAPRIVDVIHVIEALVWNVNAGMVAFHMDPAVILPSRCQSATCLHKIIHAHVVVCRAAPRLPCIANNVGGDDSLLRLRQLALDVQILVLRSWLDSVHVKPLAPLICCDGLDARPNVASVNGLPHLRLVRWAIEGFTIEAVQLVDIASAFLAFQVVLEQHSCFARWKMLLQVRPEHLANGASEGKRQT